MNKTINNKAIFTLKDKYHQKTRTRRRKKTVLFSQRDSSNFFLGVSLTPTKFNYTYICIYITTHNYTNKFKVQRRCKFILLLSYVKSSKAVLPIVIIIYLKYYNKYCTMKYSSEIMVIWIKMMTNFKHFLK